MKKSLWTELVVPIISAFVVIAFVTAALLSHREVANYDQRVIDTQRLLTAKRQLIETQMEYISQLILIQDSPDLESEKGISSYVEKIRGILGEYRKIFFVLVTFDLDVIGIGKNTVSVLSRETGYKLQHYEYEEAIRQQLQVDSFFNPDRLFSGVTADGQPGWMLLPFNTKKYWGTAAAKNDIARVWIGIEAVDYMNFCGGDEFILETNERIIHFSEQAAISAQELDNGNWYSFQEEGWGTVYIKRDVEIRLWQIIAFAVFSSCLFSIVLILKRYSIERSFQLLLTDEQPIKELDNIITALNNSRSLNNDLWLENQSLRDSFRLAGQHIRHRSISMFGEHTFWDSLLDYKYYLEPMNYIVEEDISFEQLLECIHKAAAGNTKMPYEITGSSIGMKANKDVLLLLFSYIFEFAANEAKAERIVFELFQGVNVHMDPVVEPSERFITLLKRLASYINGFVSYEDKMLKITLSSDDFIFISPDTREKQNKNMNVLVLEDEDITSMYIQRILENAGFKVRTAIDGYEALIILMEENIQLIVTDITMPRMNGIEFAAKARNLPRYYTVPIIAVTAFTMEEDIEVYKEAGINDYIGKPINEQDFWRILGPYLRLNE